MIDDYNREGYSKRGFLTMLDGHIDPDLIEFLRYNYKHCIGINSTRNQVRAFAVALRSQLQLQSNHQYYKTLRALISSRQTFVSLTLSNLLTIDKDRTVSQLIEECDKLLRAAVQRISDVDSGLIDFVYQGIQLPDTDPDNLSIRILSKIFGVTSKIVIKDSSRRDLYITDTINPELQNYRPTFHFLQNPQNFKVYVLITPTHDYEENFDVAQQISRGPRKLLISQEVNPQIIDDRTTSYQFLRYLVDTSNLCNEVIATISGMVEGGRPVFFEQGHEFKEKAFRIKMNRIQNNLQIKEEYYGMKKPLILKYNTLVLESRCSYCGDPDTQLQLECKCYYHSKCMINIFNNLINNSRMGPMENASYPCVKCKFPIKLLYFLALDIGEQFQEICKEIFLGLVKCSLCNKDVPLVEVGPYTHEGCSERSCHKCALKKFVQNGVFQCRSCPDNFTLGRELLVQCEDCGIETLIGNIFRYFEDDEAFACKRCWFNRICIDPSNPKLSNKIQYFRDEKIKCSVCKDIEYKVFGDKKCSSNQCVVCYKCYQEGVNCQVCGLQMSDNHREW